MLLGLKGHTHIHIPVQIDGSFRFPVGDTRSADIVVRHRHFQTPVHFNHDGLLLISGIHGCQSLVLFVDFRSLVSGTVILQFYRILFGTQVYVCDKNSLLCICYLIQTGKGIICNALLDYGRGPSGTGRSYDRVRGRGILVYDFRIIRPRVWSRDIMLSLAGE